MGGKHIRTNIIILAIFKVPHLKIGCIISFVQVFSMRCVAAYEREKKLEEKQKENKNIIIIRWEREFASEWELQKKI